MGRLAPMTGSAEDVQEVLRHLIPSYPFVTDTGVPMPRMSVRAHHTTVKTGRVCIEVADVTRHVRDSKSLDPEQEGIDGRSADEPWKMRNRCQSGSR